MNLQEMLFCTGRLNDRKESLFDMRRRAHLKKKSKNKRSL